MRRFKAPSDGAGRAVLTAGRTQMVGMAVVGVLAFGLVAGAGSAAASTNYACPGLGSLEKLTTGLYNVACGFEALNQDTTGNYNVASGPYALSKNEKGNENVASGTSALFSNTTGNGNVASGLFALFSNTTGNENVAGGYEALSNNKTGSLNIASGPYALYSNLEGGSNVALGVEAGKATTGSHNIDVSNVGVPGESGTTRIGTEGTQTKTFVSGIYPAAPPEGSKTCTVKVTEKGQLLCSEPAAPKGLKICVQEKEGGSIKLPKEGACKKGYKAKEVAEL